MKIMVENSKTARKRFENGSETARKRLVNVGHFLAVLLVLLTIGIGNAWGRETTYIFNSASWGATCGGSDANWTSGAAGTAYTNNGIQVTTTSTGANGTSPISFTNVTKIVATYNTNKSKGEGTIDFKVGTNDAVSEDWAYSGSDDGTSANFTCTHNYATPQSGAVKITLNTTTNSIYLVSVTITTANSTAYTVTYNAEGGTCETSSTKEASADAGVTLPDASPSAECDSEGWALYGWATSACSPATGTAPTIVGKAGETYYPSDDITLHAVYAKGEYTKETSSITSGSKYLIVGNTGGHNYIMKSSSDDFKDYSGYNGMDAAQIDETSTGKYHATVINSSWCYTIEGTAGSYYIRDVVNSSSSNYADIAYAAWWGHSKDETYTITVSSGIWTIQNNYDDDGYAYLGFDDSDLAFFAYGSAKDILLYRQTTTPSYFSNPDCIYDYFVDKVHGNEIDPKQGTYSMPASPGDEAKGDASCAEEHYHFMGWVEDVYVNRNGTLKSGYTLYPAGHSGHTAANKTFYAIWAAEE